eukprot:2160167-Pyramimonas_sp.AAC.1
MNKNCSPSTSQGASAEQSTLGAQESPCANPRDGHTASWARAPATWHPLGPVHAAKDTATKSDGTSAAWGDAIPASWGAWS